MNDDEMRQHLESCLNHQVKKTLAESEVFQILLDDFEQKMITQINDRAYILSSFIQSAKDLSLKLEKEIRDRDNRVKLRILKSLIVVIPTLLIFQFVFKSVSVNLCQFFHVETRTNYETQKPCE
jgi:hypothetical protein